MENIPKPHHLVERGQALCKGQDGEVDEGTNGCVVVQRHQGVHLEAVQEDLDHDKPRCLELIRFGQFPILSSEASKRTYCNRSSLRDETN